MLAFNLQMLLQRFFHHIVYRIKIRSMIVGVIRLEKKGSRVPPVRTTVEFSSWFILKLSVSDFFVLFFHLFVHSLSLHTQSCIKRPFHTLNFEKLKVSLFLTKQVCFKVQIKTFIMFFLCSSPF